MGFIVICISFIWIIILEFIIIGFTALVYISISIYIRDISFLYYY